MNVERALTERNEALLAAEQLRNDFVHHVSYELRSPLTNIIGFIQLLGDEGVGPLNAKQREYAGYVQNSSAALLAIINDILDLASIDRDAMELQLGEVDIESSIREAARGVQDRLAESQVELSIVTVARHRRLSRRRQARSGRSCSRCCPTPSASPIPGQTVTLAALRRENEIVIKVSDHGRGIPPELLDKVFDRFESRTLNSRHRGVGLGLSIVRAFVELHGGRVRIDSAPGEGTVVTCLFPLHKADKDEPLRATRRQEGRSMTAKLAPVWRSELPDEDATQALAREIAGLVGADDLVTLSGELGAGKTTFARALIRELTGDPELETPSPTFTLMQVYETPAFPIVHADLYRVKDPSELAELGWDEAAEGALVLVEWAERAGSALHGDRLDIALFTDSARGPDFRRAEITGHGALAQRLLAGARAADRSEARRLGRRRAPAHAGRRFDPRL